MQSNSNPYAGYSLRRGGPAASPAFNSDWMMGGAMSFDPMASLMMQVRTGVAAPSAAAASASSASASAATAAAPSAAAASWNPMAMSSYVRNLVQAPLDFYRGAPLRRPMTAAGTPQVSVGVTPNMHAQSHHLHNNSGAAAAAMPTLKVSVGHSVTPIDAVPEITPPVAILPTTSDFATAASAMRAQSSSTPSKGFGPLVPKAYDMWGSLDSTPLWKQVQQPHGSGSANATTTSSSVMPIATVSSAVVESLWRNSTSESSAAAGLPMPILPTAATTSLTNSALAAFAAASATSGSSSTSAFHMATAAVPPRCVDEDSLSGSDDMAWLDEIKERVHHAMQEDDERQFKPVASAFTLEWARVRRDECDRGESVCE